MWGTREQDVGNPERANPGPRCGKPGKQDVGPICGEPGNQDSAENDDGENELDGCIVCLFVFCVCVFDFCDKVVETKINKIELVHAMRRKCRCHTSVTACTSVSTSAQQSADITRSGHQVANETKYSRCARTGTWYAKNKCT